MKKDVLCILTFTVATLFSVAFLSTLKPTTVAVALGGKGKPDRCTLAQSPITSCQTDGLTALRWSVAAMVMPTPKDHLPPAY
jgi:hypothetical protein